MAVVLTTGVFALERLLLGGAPMEALVDAALVGVISFVVLTYWKG
jgi:hypothetical protein